MTSELDSLPEHSPLGASGASRWFKCPGSPRVRKGMPNHTSVHAAEGTLAHELGERLLNDEDPQDVYDRGFYVGNVMEQEGYDIEITNDFVKAVQVYINHISDLEYKIGPDCEIHIEQKFHLKSIHPLLFGTGDAVLYDPNEKVLYVRDYKHGAGIPVDVEDVINIVYRDGLWVGSDLHGNLQLLYYALGALVQSGYPAVAVDVGIVQPRCEHPDGPIRTMRVDVIDLLEWSYDLAAAAKATEDPEAPLCPGESQCRWCNSLCPALIEQAQHTAQVEFSKGESYDEELLAESLELVGTLEAWCKSVRAFAYAEAESGQQVLRHKLVAKRATRKWRSETNAQSMLEKAGLSRADLLNDPKLRSPTQVETAIGKKEFEEFSNLVEKKSSGTTLVHESDKREEAKTASAKDDFDDFG